MKQPATFIWKIIWLILIVTAIVWPNAHAQIRIGAPSTDPINSAAALEIKSGPYSDNTYRGLLLPRVALINYATWTLAGTPTDGMMVFNTATTTGNYAVTPGLYCWYNFQWNRQSQANPPAIITAIDCQQNTPATGQYLTGISLTSGNRKQVSITPASAGPYSAATNTVNGYSFSASGTFTTAQVGVPQTIFLQGSGVPQTTGTNTLTLTVEAQTCNFTVNVSNYVDCSGPLSGVYKVNQPLDPTNTKQITIVPQVAGNYDFFSTVFENSVMNTYTFLKRNVTITTAQVGIPQTIILQANGTPKLAGTVNAVLLVSTDGGQNYTPGCTFSVTIAP